MAEPKSNTTETTAPRQKQKQLVLGQGSHPHIKWVDLQDTGVLTEVAVMKKDNTGNLFYFEVASLDDIDKRRLAKIVSSRSAPQMELYDLMSGITLNNGCNALEYFHQLVKVRTPKGVIMKPQLGKVGAPLTIMR